MYRVCQKVINFPFIRLYLCEKDVVFVENNKKYSLKVETGWWTEEGFIYVYTKNFNSIIKFGVFVHELIEFILEGKLRFKHKSAHRLANIVEILFTFGRSKIYN